MVSDEYDGHPRPRPPGLRFAVPTPDAAVRLRYDPAAAPAVPAPFVALLPAGPVIVTVASTPS